METDLVIGGDFAPLKVAEEQEAFPEYVFDEAAANASIFSPFYPCISAEPMLVQLHRTFAFSVQGVPRSTESPGSLRFS